MDKMKESCNLMYQELTTVTLTLIKATDIYIMMYDQWLTHGKLSINFLIVAVLYLVMN